MSNVRCVIQTLDNPLLNGIALGLSAGDDGQLVVQSTMFPCCAAEGMAWSDRDHGYHSCQIKGRLRRAQALMRLFQKYWPKSGRHPLQVPPAWAAQSLQEIASMLRRDSPPAALIYSQQKAQASILWSKAFAATWRFGIEARVLNLQEATLSDLAAFTADAEGPLALFVEQIDKLWDPMLVERLEFIIQRAYNADAFLWMDFILGNAPSAEVHDDGSLRSSLSRRLNKLRTQHPIDYLSTDCLSRLQHLAGGPLRGDSRHA